ncbi:MULTISPECIES: flippase [unclassified Pseudoalteromonas]|uniref:flippase n=1 Tax=unclassified Pseudoalteromonas TaxID=194690 RepID=UPI0030152242
MKALSNSIWMMLEKVLKLGLALIVTAQIARYLGPTSYGVFSLSLTILAILTVISLSGLNRITVREVVESISTEDTREILTTVFYIRLIISFLLYLIFSSALFVYGYEYWLGYSLVFLSIIFTPFNSVDLYFQSVNKLKVVSFYRSASSVVSSLIKLILVYYQADIFYLFLAVFIEYLLVALFLFLCVKKEMNFFNPNSFSLKKAKCFLSESWVEVIAGFGGILFMKLDIVMLQYLDSSESVGLYSAATRLSEAWYFIPASIITVTFPAVIKAKKENDGVYKDKLLLLMTLISFISLLSIATLTFIAKDIVLFIFGESYLQSASVLMVHCWVCLFIFLGSTSGSYMAAEKLLKYNLYRNLIGLLINIIANCLLIPQYGGIGAAYATLIAVVFAFLLSDLLFHPIRFLFFLKIKSLIPIRLFRKAFEANFIKF